LSIPFLNFFSFFDFFECPLFSFPLKFFLIADGKIYVQTFKREKNKSEFYIFDLDGKLIRKVMAPFRESELLCAYPYTIANGKIYQVTENEDTEEWELHIDEI